MLSLLTVATLLIGYTNSCSIAMSLEGTYFISNVQLLSIRDYPNEVLLTIGRTTDYSGSTSSRLIFDSDGPWCKQMNINDGSTSPVVSCDAYTTRPWATADDTSSTTVSCQDNCDGSTATCVINRKNGDTYTNYTITDLPYTDSSSTGCDPGTPVLGVGISISFTIGDTTYISFPSNMFGIKFNDAGSGNPYDIFTVDRDGDESGWNYLTPSSRGFGLSGGASVYSTVNVISIGLTGGMCYGYVLYQYDIISDVDTLTQTFTLNTLPFWGGGYIDDVNLFAFNWGLGYSNQVDIYDFNTGFSNALKPDVCDVVRDDCPYNNVPCDEPGLECPYNRNAKCVNDYCGGCNARWNCGIFDVTTYCDSGETSTDTCLTPAPITITTQPETESESTTEAATTETTEDGDIVATGNDVGRLGIFVGFGWIVTIVAWM